MEDLRKEPMVVATVVCTAAAVLGHAILWVSYALNWTDNVPWQPVVGISLSIVAIAAFGGFYIASRRARVAIASCFLLTFLVTLTFVLTIKELTDISAYAQALMDDFRYVVTLIVGFYFGSEAAVSVAKVWRAGTAEVQQADRDLVMPAAPPATSS